MESRTGDGFNAIAQASMSRYRGVSIVVQQVKNPTSVHEDVGSISGLAQWGKDLVLLLAMV